MSDWATRIAVALMAAELRGDHEGTGVIIAGCDRLAGWRQSWRRSRPRQRDWPHTARSPTRRSPTSQHSPAPTG